MNNQNNRATRAIVASGSLLAIIFIAGPWVDEYLRLRREAAELSALEDQFVQTQQRAMHLGRVSGKLGDQVKAYEARCCDPTKTESVRERIVEAVRKAGGRIRRLEINDSETRIWAMEGDNPRLDTMPLYGEESRFVLIHSSC